MYTHSISNFGNYEKHTLQHAATGNSIALIPECGAILLEACFNGINVIDGYTKEEELETLKWGKSIFLYPFPNRLDGGRYTFEGKAYQFPINNEATANAIHGLGRNKPFQVKAIVCAAHYASITCRYEYEGNEPSYPFPFHLEVSYFISDGNAVEVNMQFTNTGNTNLPVGLGWHPYFAINDNVEEVLMQMPDIQLVEIDERMLPTGKKTTYDAFHQLRPIGNTTLDNGFYIFDQATTFGVSLQSHKGNLRYWQDIGKDKFNFVQIFTPNHRKSIAIEPMTCNVNAFNNGEGLKILAPNETFGGNFGFNFFENKNQIP